MNQSKLSLYAYFGDICFFNADMPGHSFYQLGLLDSIAKFYDVKSFDFYNYLDGYNTCTYTIKHYPTGDISNVFIKYSEKLLNEYRLSYDMVIDNIKKRAYNKLFLKARFRNLSTLAKDLYDAKIFEEIIMYALESNYDPKDIFIIDTDLSLSTQFLEYLAKHGIQRIVPSIDLPGVGFDFMYDSLEVYSKVTTKKAAKLIYHGNLDFSNYKLEHHKNPIILDIIQSISDLKMIDGQPFELTLASKYSAVTTKMLETNQGLKFIPRQNREQIWEALTNSLASINVSKDLYLEQQFTPARVYSALIAGTIPVSYKFGLLPALSFETVPKLFEISKFLNECTQQDYFNVLEQSVDSLYSKHL